jgi:RNA polymerase sigma-70 factor (ECF subfamily)
MSSSLPEPQPDVGGPSPIQAAYGFIPHLFLAQAQLPAALEAESALVDAILLRGNGLSRTQKDAIISAVAVARRNGYVFALHGAEYPGSTSSLLLEFALKLACRGPFVASSDIETLRAAGLSDCAVLELIATVGLGTMLCTLATALNPAPDAGLSASTLPPPSPTETKRWNTGFGPYLKSETATPSELASLLRDQYGFVPGVFRAQTLLPELLVAESKALELVIFSEDHLTRLQKESILLAVSLENLSTYGVALHSQVLAVLGNPPEAVDAIIDASENLTLEKADRVLISSLSQLSTSRHRTSAGLDRKALREVGFNPPQILEAIAAASLGQFFNALAFGLSIPPDFPPRRIFTEKDLYPPNEVIRLTSDAEVRADPDADLVARVQAGETEPFEELTRRHMRRIFGILNGMLGNYDEAHEATQETFVKAFEHIRSFQGRSKFSTWLTSIAVNTGTEMLRQRKPTVPLDEAADEDFRPRQVMSWNEDPEALFAAAQMKALVRDAVLRLPHKYRVAVLLRDINQLSTEDAAEALGLSVPALKARVLRGRLMLRESLAPHFLPSEEKHA